MQANRTDPGRPTEPARTFTASFDCGTAAHLAADALESRGFRAVVTQTLAGDWRLAAGAVVPTGLRATAEALVDRVIGDHDGRYLRCDLGWRAGELERPALSTDEHLLEAALTLADVAIAAHECTLVALLDPLTLEPGGHPADPITVTITLDRTDSEGDLIGRCYRAIDAAVAAYDEHRQPA